jgi:hypothetical protein
MDYSKISGLVNKYWEGETTLEEEILLREFFSTHTELLPADLQEAAPLFLYFKDEAVKEWPEVALPELPAVLTIAATNGVMKPVRISPWQNWMKYAAILLMAVGMGYGGQQFLVKQAEMKQTLAQKDSFDDPEKAFAETQKALQLLAKNLNKGTSQMQKLAYFDEATGKIEGNN